MPLPVCFLAGSLTPCVYDTSVASPLAGAVVGYTPSNTSVKLADSFAPSASLPSKIMSLSSAVRVIFAPNRNFPSSVVTPKNARS